LPALVILAHVSRRVTVRLKTGLSPEEFFKSNELKKLQRGIVIQGMFQQKMEEIMSLSHFATALSEVIDTGGADIENWTSDPVEIVKKAWQSELIKELVPKLRDGI